MEGRPWAELAETAGELRGRIEGWRGTRRTSTERMPERLWTEAARLARVYGVSRVARALRLDYRALKRRVGGKGGRGEVLEASPAVFLELGLPSAGREGVVVELASGDGAKLTARLPDTAGLDLVSLAEAFWRRGR